MNNLLISVMILFANTTIFSQIPKVNEKMVYKTVMDSLLSNLENQIKRDLIEQGFRIEKQTIANVDFDGYIMLVEVFFKPRLSYIVAIVTGKESSMLKKFNNQTKGLRIRRQIYYDGFVDYIEKHRKVPVEYIVYKFISFFEDSPPDHFLYGEYAFRMNDNGEFEIEERINEVLRNENEFMSKYNSNF